MQFLLLLLPFHFDIDLKQKFEVNFGSLKHTSKSCLPAFVVVIYYQ